MRPIMVSGILGSHLGTLANVGVVYVLVFMEVWTRGECKRAVENDDLKRCVLYWYRCGISGWNTK